MNINLGTFSWDISKLEKQIIENRKQMELFSSSLNLNKKALEQEKKELQELGVKSAFVQKAQEELKEQFKQGTISQEEYSKASKENTQALDELDAKGKEIAKNQAQHIKTIIDQENAIKILRNENAELNKLFEVGRTEIQGNEGVYRDLNAELNALKTEAKNLGAELVLLRREGKENTEEYRALEEQWREVSRQADELNDDFKAIDKAVGDNQRSVGDYKDQIVSASSEIMGGLREIANGNIAGGIETITGSFGELKTSFNSLMATMMGNPMTAVLVGITAVATGIGLAVKEFFDYNNQVRELNREVEMFTNTTGFIVDEIRLNATAIQEAYGKEFNEAVKEMNSLMTDFGLSAQEAFELYNKGMADGGALNDEFGDSIREYGVLMEQNGYTAEEYINLLNAGIDLDIYTDKLPDAIKEAGLSLTENTKATRDALINAFGEPFSNDLLKRVELGQTSVKDALLEISKKSKESNLTLQQQAQLTADVFRGAGEDAGGALKIFEAINLAHEKETQELQGLAKHTAEMTQLQKELAQAKDDAMKSDAIQEFSQNMDKMWVRAQIVWYGLVEGITNVVKWIDEVTGLSETLGETWDAVSDFANELWKLVESLVGVFSDLFSSLGANNDETKSFIKEVFKAINPITKLKILLQGLATLFSTLSNWINTGKIRLSAFGITAKNILSQISSVANSIKNLDFSGALEKLKNISISKELANARKEAQALNKEVKKPEIKDNSKITTKDNRNTLADREDKIKQEEEARKRAEADAKKAISKAEADRKKAIEDKRKEMEQEAKRTIDLQKETSEQNIKVAKSELAEYIRINAEKYKDDKRLTNDKLQDQIEYFNEVKRQQLAVLALEEKNKLASIKIKEDEINRKKSLSENDKTELENLNNERKIIEKEYQGEREKISSETDKKIADTQKSHEEKVAEQRKLSKAIEYQQRILDLENQGATEYEIRQVQLDQETQQKLDAFIKENELKLELDNDNYISQQEIQIARKELEDEIKLTDDENEKIRLQNKLDQLAIIEQEHADKSRQIIRSVDEYKLQSRQQVLNGLATLFGKESGLGKVFAAAQITNDTVMNASKAFNQASVFASNPLTAPLAVNAYIQGGIIVASGAVQLAKLVAPTPKAQRGMLIKGNSHAMGGVPISTPNGMIEAEGGEVIINKVSSMMFKDLLSDINVAGGGVKFAKGGIVGSNLSNIQNTISNNKPTEANLSSEAISKIAEAIYSGSQRGISNLNENLSISNNANF